MELHKQLGIRKVDGDVGVEIEVEGKNLPTRVLTFWQPVKDGSLRNGIEYIIHGAIGIEKMPEALDELHQAFIERKSQLDFSFRTSVHVHVNCHTLSYVQLLNFIYTGYLLEGILMDFSGEVRKGNRFCLRLKDADGLSMILNKMFSISMIRDAIHLLRQDDVKYAAMNLGSLRNKGTLEFRSMRGTIDPEVLLPWTNALVNIRDYARKKQSPLDVQKDFIKNPEKFAQKALGNAEYEIMYHPELYNSLMENHSLTFELPHLKRPAPQVKIAPDEVGLFDLGIPKRPIPIDLWAPPVREI